MNAPNPQKKYLPPQVVDTALQGWARSGRCSTFTVSGNSMHPILHHGDVLVITHGIQSLRPGDLLAFRQGKMLTVHRLLRVVKQADRVCCLTKGDNCRQLDALVSLDQLVGVVRSMRRGKREYYLHTTFWRFAGALIAASGRIGLRLDSAGLHAKRRILGSAHNPVTGFLRRANARLADLPAHLVDWLLWRKS